MYKKKNFFEKKIKKKNKILKGRLKLLVTFFRAILLYTIVLIVMRLMGKRE